MIRSGYRAMALTIFVACAALAQTAPPPPQTPTPQTPPKPPSEMTTHDEPAMFPKAGPQRVVDVETDEEPAVHDGIEDRVGDGTLGRSGVAP